jgi:uncharacterized membrane protein SpoIIM required for sporulation
MIIDVQKFIAAERPHWNALAEIVAGYEADPYRRLDFVKIKRLHYLYQRASADLAKISTFSAEREIRSYLESLVGRSYAVIHASPRKAYRFTPLAWLGQTFPQTLRRHLRALALAVGVTLVGALFGSAAVTIDQDAKEILMPFEHLQMDPAKRVAQEEKTGTSERLTGVRGQFSAILMTHNIRVSIGVLALGMTWGIGTVLLLFYNGVLLGAVAADYVAAGQTPFVLGWLLPHGAVEIPAILVAGQAGLVLAGALIGTGQPRGVRDRLRAVANDVVTLMGGAAVMLVWAGLVESFLSQYHAPVVPYGAKIAFGLAELLLLIGFLATGGRRRRMAVRCQSRHWFHWRPRQKRG